MQLKNPSVKLQFKAVFIEIAKSVAEFCLPMWLTPWSTTLIFCPGRNDSTRLGNLVSSFGIQGSQRKNKAHQASALGKNDVDCISIYTTSFSLDSALPSLAFIVMDEIEALFVLVSSSRFMAFRTFFFFLGRCFFDYS